MIYPKGEIKIMELQRSYVEQAIEEAVLDPDEVIREDYSGRGMYGRTCFALDCDDLGQAALILVNLASLEIAADGDAVNARFLAKHMRTDSMGLGIVAYFPIVNLV